MILRFLTKPRFGWIGLAAVLLVAELFQSGLWLEAIVCAVTGAVIIALLEQATGEDA